MFRSKKFVAALVSCTVSVLVASSVMSTADAAESTTGAQVAVQKAPPTDLAVTTSQSDGSLTAKTTTGGSVSLPSKTDGKISSVSGSGDTVQLGLPVQNSKKFVKSTTKSTALYSGNANASFAVQATTTGFRALINATSAETSDFAFPVSLPSNTTLHAATDGVVEVLRADGSAVGMFDTPWAIDANGVGLPTAFRIDGNKLVQHIDFTGAAFPVTADPSYIQDCGIVTCTHWISVATTKWMYENRMNSTNAAWAAIAGVKCGAVGVFAFGSAGVACGAWDGYMIYKMNVAMENAWRGNGCVKWKWSRQFGQGFPIDWTWTTPARDAKCKWS